MDVPEHKEEEQGGSESGMGRWLLTYADLITLLLLFFIVLYAMSVINTKKYDELATSLGFGFRIGTSALDLGSKSLLPNIKIAGQQSTQPGNKQYVSQLSLGNRLTVIYNEYLSAFQPELEARKLRIVHDERGIVVQIGADSYFGAGSADIVWDFSSVLDRTARLLVGIPNTIRIEGYTDSAPTTRAGGAPSQFASNWELSAQRAINVLKYFADLGVSPARMSAVAYADTKPLASNDTPEGRAYNRRVDIVIQTLND
jgi:chemotaxis protein MotB